MIKLFVREDLQVNITIERKTKDAALRQSICNAPTNLAILALAGNYTDMI
jgi:hypothetical protein